jgi:N-acetylglucosaminyldiphosphoundecaprenol N-acetyl-beta-D-mannosaminyltransferase
MHEPAPSAGSGTAAATVTLLYPGRRCADVLGSPIDVIDWGHTLDILSGWAGRRESRYVCICNAHSVVTATQDTAFRQVLAGADMVTPDGAPVAWLMRRTGHLAQERINGPDLMLKLCERAAAEGTSIFLLGSTPQTLAALQHNLRAMWPGLRIAGALSPPFRELSAQEDDELVATVNQAHGGVVFVSLGCPKQERWMAAHRGRINAVMIGVGAAFDFHAGTVARAPAWMRDHGLEWLHRLASEPRRLWRRYLVTNLAFIGGAIKQLLQRGR